MKKIRLFAALLALTLTLTACGKEQETTTPDAPEDGGDAQKEMYVIGISQYGEHASLDNCREGFLQGLEQAGLVEGVDFTYDYQNAGFDDNIATQIGQSFSAQDVDLMVGIATNSAVACFAAAEDKDIPVIFTAITDPVQAKLDSGNITGTSDKLPVEAQLDLIRQLQPNAKTIGIIYTTSEPSSVSTSGRSSPASADPFARSNKNVEAHRWPPRFFMFRCVFSFSFAGICGIMIVSSHP